ncbi:MAG: PKD domain-containing protein, partial [Sphingobacteriia bacterium]
NAAAPPDQLSLIPLTYNAAYSGSSPLGDLVKIDAQTGIISGIGPNPGTYVVSVCITEWRNRKPINEHRKDFILEVQSCDYLDADLPDQIIECKTLAVKFENQSSSSSILRYEWSFGDSLVNKFPQAGTVVHNYPAAGVYTARLTVFGPKGCVGTDSTRVSVFPGFQAGFTTNGTCIQNPYLFRDTTRSVHGTVNAWKWDFGEDSSLSDTSLLKLPSYSYLSAATKLVQLVVSDSRGCRDTVRKNLVVSNTPTVPLPFKDTLICSIDTLPIHITNTGQFQWQPAYNILGATTASPKVFPQKDTWYSVVMDDKGCKGSDSLLVRVLPFVSVDAGKDTVICAGDPLRLNPTSVGLQFQWTSSAGETIAPEKNPVVRPNQAAWYTVIANLGKCQDKDSLWVNTLPYPQAYAGRDTMVCSATRINLEASLRGTRFAWSPTNAMLNANSLRPVVAPSKTTTYVLSVQDSLGCPKTVRDSVTIVVVPPLLVSAGPDSFVVKNQPVQLNASGAETYLWSPAKGLNDPTLPNPIATPDGTQDSIRYRVVGSTGICSASDEMVLYVFQGGATILIPSAFSPNGDGLNDVLRPIALGLSSLDYFRVYNRWGNLVFETKQIGQGWNGWFKGEKQGPGTYVVEAQGIDMEGKRLYTKGTAVLVR